jgi:uncharacterized membrane protein YhaH (DUF805 family)
MNWYLQALNKYAEFNGRARRKEYWFFVLFNILISLALGIVDHITGSFDPTSGVGLLGGIYAIALLLPGLTVTVRRLHDTDRSGWWVLLPFIPILGGLILFYFLVLDSTPGRNEYGDSPK